MKTLLLITLIALSPFVLIAQDKIRIGIEGGINRSMVGGQAAIKSMNKYNQTFQHDPVVNFAGGFTFQYSFTDALALKTGLLYERKGSIITFSSVTFTDQFGNVISHKSPTDQYSFSYLTLPILIRYNYRFLFINAGPYASLLVKQSNVYDGIHVQNPKQGIVKYDNSHLYNSFDAGLMAGLGFEVPINKIRLSLEGRFSQGLVDISKDPEETKTQSTYLLFGASYVIKQLSDQ